MRTVEQMKKWLEEEIKQADKILADFNDKFMVNPAYSLSWADETFKAAAAKEKYTMLLNTLNQNESITASSMVEWVTEDVVFKAGGREHSTSPCSNMIERYRLAVLAAFMKYITK